MANLLIRGGKVAMSGAESLLPADILVRDGRIESVMMRGGADADVPGREGGPDLSGAEVFDAEGQEIYPGGIDPHVHFDDPGYTHREDFGCGTAAAAAGGITTVVDMPCTSVPPVTNLANLKEKLAVVAPKAHVDFAFYGGVSGQMWDAGPEAAMAELAPYVRGFKVYGASGMESFRRLGSYELEGVLRIAKKLGLPVLLHAEDGEYIDRAAEAAKKSGNTPRDYYMSRPETAELLSINAAALLARRTGASLHVVHLAVAEGAPVVLEAGGTTETCPHYLEFDLDDFEMIGAPLKTAPPIKHRQKELLWKYLAAGTISFVASDHAPAPWAEKSTGSIWTDYGGIPGCGTLWPYMYSEGLRRGRLGLGRFLEALSENAARRYGMWDRKGSIETGKDADLLLVDPAASWTVRGAEFLSRGKITPFEGRTFQGKIVKTLLRGKTVWDSREGLAGEPGWGKFLSKEGK
jgi:allantoinase